MATQTQEKNNAGPNNRNGQQQRPQRRQQGRGPRRDQQPREFEQRVVDIARVNRMVAGGRRFRFRTTMLIGDGKGKIGMGLAKGSDVQISIQKAVSQAKKHMIVLQLNERNTVPFVVEGKFKKSHVILKPAPEGHGIVAGSSARMICELAGVTDISVKLISRSKNKLNVAKAMLDAFAQVARAAEIHGEAALRSPKKPTKETATKKAAPKAKKPATKKAPAKKAPAKKPAAKATKAKGKTTAKKK